MPNSIIAVTTIVDNPRPLFVDKVYDRLVCCASFCTIERNELRRGIVVIEVLNSYFSINVVPAAEVIINFPVCKQ